MKIVQTCMWNINLNFFVVTRTLTICSIELLFVNFKEALFNLLLHLWLKLFLHVVHLKILSFKVLKWMTTCFLNIVCRTVRNWNILFERHLIVIEIFRTRLMRSKLVETCLIISHFNAWLLIMIVPIFSIRWHIWMRMISFKLTFAHNRRQTIVASSKWTNACIVMLNLILRINLMMLVSEVLWREIIKCFRALHWWMRTRRHVKVACPESLIETFVLVRWLNNCITVTLANARWALSAGSFEIFHGIRLWIRGLLLLMIDWLWIGWRNKLLFRVAAVTLIEVGLLLNGWQVHLIWVEVERMSKHLVSRLFVFTSKKLAFKHLLSWSALIALLFSTSFSNVL